MSSSNQTQDHDEIRKWAEARGGRPSFVRRTESGGKGKPTSGVLRFDFGPKEEGFDEVDWEGFFRVFDESGLTFLYQDKTKDGKQSRFNKFIRAEGDAKRSGGQGSGGRASGGARGASGSKQARGRGGAGKGAGGGGRTKAELMELARKRNVPGRSRMNKAELAKAVA